MIVFAASEVAVVARDQAIPGLRSVSNKLVLLIKNIDSLVSFRQNIEIESHSL